MMWLKPSFSLPVAERNGIRGCDTCVALLLDVRVRGQRVHRYNFVSFLWRLSGVSVSKRKVTSKSSTIGCKIIKIQGRWEDAVSFNTLKSNFPEHRSQVTYQKIQQSFYDFWVLVYVIIKSKCDYWICISVLLHKAYWQVSREQKIRYWQEKTTFLKIPNSMRVSVWQNTKWYVKLVSHSDQRWVSSYLRNAETQELPLHSTGLRIKRKHNSSWTHRTSYNKPNALFN